MSEQGTSDQAPAWAEMKTKAGKDRKRLPLACIACRRKKIRCSGEKPACKHCLKSRTPCVYKLSARKVGPRTDYMAMLDKRLKRMEDRVIKIIPKEEFDGLPDVSRAVVKPSVTQTSSRADSRKRSANEAFGPDLDEWAKGKPAGQSGEEKTEIPTPRTNNPDESSLLRDGKDQLPSREIQEHLVEVYFEYVYGQSYHLLHKPSFMRKLLAGTVPPVLLLAVCAVSARFSNHPQLKTEPAFLRGEQWSNAAREIAIHRFDWPNITILTVFVLLGLHEFGTCQGGRSWALCGMAIRMAYALQLHKDLAFEPTAESGKKSAELSPTDREIRRRTMWACFIMDRFNSSGTQRPLFSSEEYLELQLPVKEQSFIEEYPGVTEPLHPPTVLLTDSDKTAIDEARGNMGVAAFMIRIVALFGRIVQYLNLGGLERDPHPLQSEKSGYTLLRRQVQAFQESLPENLRSTDENLKIHVAEHTANQYLYIHIVYYGCVLFINRMNSPAGAKAVLDTMSKKDREEVRSKAINAANSISQLLPKATQHRCVAPFAGYCAYTASLVHIHAAFSRDTEVVEISKVNLKINILYLSNMKKYWGNFHFLMDSLRELWQNYADLAGKGTATPTPKLRALQYGDWYDRYPNGVTQTDFQVPRDSTGKETGVDAVMAEKRNPQSVEQFFAGLSPDSRAKRSSISDEHQVGATKSGRGRNSKSISKKRGKPTVQMVDADIDQVDFSSRATHFPESYDRSPIFPQQQQQQLLQQQQPSAAQLIPDITSNDRIQDPLLLQALQSQPLPATANPAGGPIPLSQLGEMDPLLEPDLSTGFWDLDFSNISGLGDEFLGEPQNSWFMPFNLNPPDLDLLDTDAYMGQTLNSNMSMGMGMTAGPGVQVQFPSGSNPSGTGAGITEDRSKMR